jgi:tetratricopeptide (TPR) repeat protein
VVERFGLPVQRAAFFIQSVNLNLRRDRYMVSAATLAYCEAAVYASEEAGDLDAMTWAHFAMGGSRLFRGDIDEAEMEIQAALALAERSGDIAHQARCWTYLTLIARKRGQVDAARQAGARGLELATAGQMLEYIAMAHANEGWLAWRLGDRQATQARAHAALELWQQIRLVYPLQWTALFPLIAVAAAEDRRAAAVEYARALLAPTQQRLPGALAEATGTVIALWEGGDAEGTRAAIAQALALAEKDGYA